MLTGKTIYTGINSNVDKFLEYAGEDSYQLLLQARYDTLKSSIVTNNKTIKEKDEKFNAAMILASIAVGLFILIVLIDSLLQMNIEA